LSNIYKLYRACRVDPLNDIDPAVQVAFYDPGLGTDEDTTGWFKWSRWVKKLLGSATGRGIGHNIADCYEFIINQWEPGDRIWIFGFSRGAYTARCVANVLSLCGVPTKDADGGRLTRFKRCTRAIADEAAHEVYEHGAGYPLAEFESERNELARRFRERYASDNDGTPNASPYFIGVFDTVAALGAKGWKRVGIFATFGFAIAILCGVAATPVAWILGFPWFYVAGLLTLTAIIASSVALRMKARRTIADFPKKGDHKSHYIRWKADDYDRSLSGHVRYARHAISIDERREDFPRVKWGRHDVIRKKESATDEPLIQLWFAGNHSDIGGSYPETESRLSDVALGWMVEQATSAELPYRLQIDRRVLHVFPDPSAMQHCEIEGFANAHPVIARFVNWSAKPRKSALGAPLHPSVELRFNCNEVCQSGVMGPYRPQALREDGRFGSFYPKWDTARNV
ncbi:MAG: DUF2235 domain-containing protein, partial [Thermomicrobiales bacterium]